MKPEGEELKRVGSIKFAVRDTHDSLLRLPSDHCQAFPGASRLPESETSVVEFGRWVYGLPVGLGQARQRSQWVEAHIAMFIHSQVALSLWTFVHVIAKPAVVEGILALVSISYWVSKDPESRVHRPHLDSTPAVHNGPRFWNNNIRIYTMNRVYM